MRGDNARRIRGMVERRELELLVADAELQVEARGRETGRPAERGRATTSTHVGVGASSGGGVDQGGGDNRWGAGGVPGGLGGHDGVRG